MEGHATFRSLREGEFFSFSWGLFPPLGQESGFKERERASVIYSCDIPTPILH